MTPTVKYLYFENQHITEIAIDPPTMNSQKIISARLNLWIILVLKNYVHSVLTS